MNVVPVSTSMSPGDPRGATHGEGVKGLDKDLFPKGASKNNG